MLAQISRLRRNAAFIYPIQPAPRTAVLVPGFRSGGAIRVFNEGWSKVVSRYAPEALAGTLEQLDELSRAMVPSLTHAVVVIARVGEPRLNEPDRERLWSTFRVPIFEQIVGEDNALLAIECEAHDGVHMESRELPGDAGSIDTSPCGCGRKTPRLMTEERVGWEQRVAAYAR